MDAVSVSQFGDNLKSLVEQAISGHEPLRGHSPFRRGLFRGQCGRLGARAVNSLHSEVPSVFRVQPLVRKSIPTPTRATQKPKTVVK